MFKVIEAFSGIGSQAKALKNIGAEYEIIATMDWDISAIIAYDMIHHGEPNLEELEGISIDEMKKELKKYTFSSDGKVPLTKEKIDKLNVNVIKHLFLAIKRSKNIISITDVKGKDLPNEIDLLTYSFPCQDLSIARSWHGENGGIDRTANNRSGMLWEVERILKERIDEGLKLPKFLLMENVTNILSNKHEENFKDWKSSLENMGYLKNYVYKLNAADFGMPQRRVRAYMISVLCDDKNKIEQLEKYEKDHNLNDPRYVKSIVKNRISLEEVLRLDYSNSVYKFEAEENNPNNTPSRQKIYEQNQLIYDGNNIVCESIQTITTKQDRHPNSGVLNFKSNIEGKSNYRNLTPRECFLLMGFDEEDYQILMDNNFEARGKHKFFNKNNLHKMAGNSIVVNVLEYIFKHILYINDNIL